jgi:lipoprotein-anchoring transpeptidase ErfK/SrfK
MVKWTSLAGALVGIVALTSSAAAAQVVILIDKTMQRMTVSVDGETRYSWPVSTGMTGYETPAGGFTPSRLARRHFSREWDDAPMPYSIFFTDAGHAIHGSQAVGRLGMPASHGCVRLSPQNAGTLFNLVSAEGLESTRIEITGTDPIGAGPGGGPVARRDYRGLTSFDPLLTGIMAGGNGAGRPR